MNLPRKTKVKYRLEDLHKIIDDIKNTTFLLDKPTTAYSVLKTIEIMRKLACKFAEAKNTAQPK